MPVSPTYPGVYVEEIPSGVRTITGVSTSIAAFVGAFDRGTTDAAVCCASWADVERSFGGLRADSEASYGLRSYYLNGGGAAWVVRVAGKGATSASVTVTDSTGKSDLLTFTARSVGAWGDKVSVLIQRVTLNGSTDDNAFDLTITETRTASGGKPVTARQEVFKGLVLDTTSRRYVGSVVNDPSSGSELVIVKVEAGADPGALPAENLETVTASGPHDDTSVALETTDAGLAPNINTKLLTLKLTATIAGENAVEVVYSVEVEESQQVTDNGITTYTYTIALNELCQKLQAAMRTQMGDDSIEVWVASGTDGRRVAFKAAPDADEQTFAFEDVAGQIALCEPLKLTEDDLSSKSQPSTFVLAGGDDGETPTAADLEGSAADFTGLHALDRVDSVNLLCLPDAATIGGAAAALLTAAVTWCEARRAVLLVDPPEEGSLAAWQTTLDSLRSPSSAFYYPRLRVPDPLDPSQPREIGPSGAIAGLIARIDTARGLWKAPAGTDARLRGVLAPVYPLTDAEVGQLNPLGINCVRTLPIHGTVAWGARTLAGSDAEGSEWKYLPVRRLALFLEQSLSRGLQWVVFEPNDEPLWAQIRLNVGSFMHDLFRKGAFQGRSPREAYFVRCDKETTTQSDINSGVVNVIVGFAPLKPAEFVVLQLQQIAGQIDT